MIMYAYIEWLEGPDRAKKITVDSTEISFKFDKAEYDKNKKYKVRHANGTVYKARIINLSDSKKKLDLEVKNMNTRSNLPNKTLMETASSDDSISPRKKIKCTITKKTGKSLAEVNSAVTAKQQELKKVLRPTSSENQEKTHLNNKPSTSDKENVDNHSHVRTSVHRKSEEVMPSSASGTTNFMEYERLEAKYKSLKAETKILKQEAENYKKINFELQVEILEFFKEQKVIEKQQKSAPCGGTVINSGDNFVAIGYHKKSTNEYHIGHGIYIPSAAYDNIFMFTKSPKNCVRNILIALFERSVLFRSTASGRISNRTVGNLKSKNVEGLETNKFNKLDPSRLAAAKTFYGYWLEQVYIKREDVTYENYFAELQAFNEHVSSELAYLKRGSRKGKKLEKKQKNDQDFAQPPSTSNELVEHSDNEDEGTREGVDEMINLMEDGDDIADYVNVDVQCFINNTSPQRISSSEEEINKPSTSTIAENEEINPIL